MLTPRFDSNVVAYIFASACLFFGGAMFGGYVQGQANVTLLAKAKTSCFNDMSQGYAAGMTGWEQVK